MQHSCCRVPTSVQIPFVASGGIADGKQVRLRAVPARLRLRAVPVHSALQHEIASRFCVQLAACLALGAEGINMGTRFMATVEAPIHQGIKDALVNASELDTTLVMRSVKNTERVYKNETALKVRLHHA